MGMTDLVSNFVALARRHNRMMVARRAGIDSLVVLAKRDRDTCLESAKELRRVRRV